MLNLEKAKLIETFSDDIHEHNIDFDTDFWNEIICKLSAFVEIPKKYL